ncbi:MAG: hypothetical protein ACRCT1_00135 [Microcoleaceae cyanobacterium]
MVQNVINNRQLLESSSQTNQAEPLSVELYAERLMDDLFEDVDRILDGGTLPTEPLKPDVISLKSVTVPQIVLPPGMFPRQEEKKFVDDAAIARQVKIAVQKQQVSQSFDKIFLGAACASVLLTLGLWAATRDRVSPVGQTTSVASDPKSLAEAQAKAEADENFVDYIQRSLNSLDQPQVAQGTSPKTGQTVANSAGVTPSSNLPTLIVPGMTTGANNNLGPVLNRLADAIEQQTSRPNAPIPPAQVVILPPSMTNPKTATTPSVSPSRRAIAALPKMFPTMKTPTSSTVATTTKPVKTTTSKQTKTPSTSPSATASIPSKSAIVASQPIPQPQAAPQPSISVSPASQSPSSPVTPSAAISTTPSATPSQAVGSNHTLVGILELGDRSAALFEVEGVARRFYVGETIGASGWTLAEVKNQEAVIRKGSEVRSVFVGQKF